ncbi:PEP/pyruvate-binding domain-containing protein [Micromonospora sp. NPDC049679]|uniref:PEP/pyruvate-binding domain-containing protein n=1 Tax=Micromonospora sp. NPDC049679 TaxID=3155920 RepID=UPI0033CFACC5
MQLIWDGPGLADATRVGHKFARQDVMRRAGLPVPEFCCLTGDAFAASTPPATPFPGPHARATELVTWANSNRDRVRRGAVPTHLAEPVLAAFDALAGPGGLVAVRACAVAAADGTGEDGVADPFAGLSDSYLYVRRDAVLARVVDCWASAYNPEAVIYRVRRGVDPTTVRVAVGVQRMVSGIRSFVAFTRDPRSGADRRVIAAAHGIGEGIVQEKADIDHFFVDGATGAIEIEAVCKATMVGPAPDRPGDGPVILPVPAECAQAPVLTAAEVHHICALAATAEELFGGPQDVEGAITDDGTIHLLQARPAVVAHRPTGAEVPWTNHNLTESFPGLTSTLTYSQARVFYQAGFTDFYRRMGVDDRSLRRNRHHLSRMIGYLDGQVYYRLDAWFALHGQIPGFDLMRPLWERSLGLTERTGVPRELAGRPWLRVLRAAPRLASLLVRQPHETRSFLRWWDALVADSASLDGSSADELIARYRHMWAEAERRWGITMVNSYFGLASLALTTVLLKRWVRDGEALLPRLVAGGRPNRTLASVRSAIALAELVNERPSLRDAALQRSEREVWDDITAGRHGAEVADAFARHLAAFGDRALHDLKLEVLTPRQQPWMILSTLRPFVTQRMTVAGAAADERRASTEARSTLREGCPNPLRRAVLGTLIASLRFFVKAREDTRFCRSQLYGISRDVLWRLADRLVDAGMLDEAGDVAHLRVEEVLGAFDGTLCDADLRGLALRRKAGLAASANRAALPAYFTTPAAVPVTIGLAARRDAGTGASVTDGVLRGLASSSGRVRGRARVVLDAATSPQSCADRILVARETDPGWLPLMMVAKGMVVERGSLVSHTAITGRLLGIPTVVAVVGASTAIPDGAPVEIDGGTGTVRLLSEAEFDAVAE